MTEPSFNLQTNQIADIIRDFILLKHRLVAVLPEDFVRAKQRMSEFLPKGGTGRAPDIGLYYRIGMVLSRQKEPSTMGEISEALDVPLSTATRIVDWLVDGKYAERLSDPEDRRIVRVALTGIGHQFYQVIEGYIRQQVEKILTRFTPQEREALVPLLRKLMKVMQELAG